MKITIEPDLATSSEHFFAYPYKQFKNQNDTTVLLTVPLQQREYEWGRFSEDNNNIENLLEDLDYHISNHSDKYFAGTILLENQNNNFLKVIDGQQRITTIYLFNIIGYLISKYRLIYLPTFPNPVQYALEFKKRFDSYLSYENRIFITTLSKNIDELIDIDGQSDSNAQLNSRIGNIESSEIEYWSKIRFRLQFDDLEINESFVNTIKSSSLQDVNDVLQFKSIKSLYANGLSSIFTYLSENSKSGSSTMDSCLDEILSKLDNYLSVCGLASIISEDSDDSFRLFEILNDRGQDLSALDLIKNMILEKSYASSIEIVNFNTDWKQLKENVNKSFSKGKSDSVFIENIIRSEGSRIKNKEISYLTNKKRHGSDERNDLFIKEAVGDFYKRLIHTSQILREIQENSLNDKINNSSPFNRFHMSTLQYVTFMRMINYSWGPQIILASNIQYLKLSNYTLSLNSGTNPNWKQRTSNKSICDLNHFTRFLGDVVLKMGLIGIVNGLATKDLPTKSRDLAFMIVENVRKNPADFNSSAKLKVLIKDIIAILNRDIFNDSNIKLFESRLSETFIASTGQKRNLVKILLYFLYNQGQQTHTWNFPELEHLEPSNPLVGASPYYSNQDRVEVINRFGNFALIEKSINIVDFSNKPLIEKLRLVKENPKLSKIALFQNDLFLNLDFDNCKTSSTIYGELPLISKAQSPTLSDTDSFTFEGEPTKYFFDIRSKTLASLSKNIICNTQNFLDGSGTYL